MRLIPVTVAPASIRIYGDDLRLQPHERNWYLQVSAGAGAQAVVNGIFGIRPHSNGTLTISPHYNDTMMAPTASLANYHFRGANYSVVYSAPTFSVARGSEATGCSRVSFGRACVCDSAGRCAAM